MKNSGRTTDIPPLLAPHNFGIDLDWLVENRRHYPTELSDWGKWDYALELSVGTSKDGEGGEGGEGENENENENENDESDDESDEGGDDDDDETRQD